MKILTEYKLLMGESPYHLSEVVTYYLVERGYILFGTPFCSEGNFFQTVMKYENEPKKK